MGIEMEINSRLEEFGVCGTRFGTVLTDHDTGVSRQVRSTIDFVLHLLSITFDKDNLHQDDEALMKLKEELVYRMQNSNEGMEQLQLSSLPASGACTCWQFSDYAVEDYQKVENESFHLSQEKLALEKLVKNLEEKVSQLEYEKEIMFEEKRRLKEQCQLLGSRLADPEKKLIEQYSKLSSEKVAIEKSLMKDRQTLLSRVQQLEMLIDEITDEKEEIMEKRHKDVEDLNAQIVAMEKHLQSTKKFIDEQVYEREQEREDYCNEIQKLSNAVKDKNNIQSMGEHLSKVTESLEMQLASKTEEQNEFVAKMGKLEEEVQQAMDKSHDLEEIVMDLEKQLEIKSDIVTQLEENLNTVTNSLVIHEKNNTELKIQLEECSSASLVKDSLEKLQDLEEQLASKSQELQQMSQSDTSLKELREQINLLELTVNHRVRQLEVLHFKAFAVSPVVSDDDSHSDLDSHHMICAEGWEMSPQSVHWVEIHRLENDINQLISMEEELIKQIKDLSTQVEKLKLHEGLEAAKPKMYCVELEKEAKTVESLKECQKISSSFGTHQKHNMLCISELCNLKHEMLWVLDKLRSFVPEMFQDTANPEMKVVIEKLLEEIENMRRMMDSLHREKIELVEIIRKLQLENNSKREEIDLMLKEQRRRNGKVDNIGMLTKAPWTLLKSSFKFSNQLPTVTTLVSQRKLIPSLQETKI